MRKEEEGWARDIATEVAYTNSWNIKGYRNASILAPAWYVLTSNGLVIDIEGYVPGMFQGARIPYASVLQGPSSIVSEIGETWRLFAKAIDGGIVVVGIPANSNSTALDLKLQDSLAVFPSDVDQAARTRSRNVDVDVDYAILRDNGELLGAWGGIPIRVDHSFFGRFARGETRAEANGKSYAIFSKPICDPKGSVVGLIMMPRDITLLEAALHTQALFNISTAVALWLLVVLSSIPFVHSLISRQQRLSMHKDLLRNQELSESGTIEFKPAFQWDSKTMTENKELRFDFLLKPVAAFLNADGGTLFIGVSKDGRVCGIGGDLALLNGSADHLELQMMHLINSKIGPAHSGFVRIHIGPLIAADSLPICVVDVDAAPRPAFLKWENNVYFFKRTGNQSQQLGPIEQHEYIRTHWG